jgi:hypothetical protein
MDGIELIEDATWLIEALDNDADDNVAGDAAAWLIEALGDVEGTEGEACVVLRAKGGDLAVLPLQALRDLLEPETVVIKSQALGVVAGRVVAKSDGAYLVQPDREGWPVLEAPAETVYKLRPGWSVEGGKVTETCSIDGKAQG